MKLKGKEIIGAKQKSALNLLSGKMDFKRDLMLFDRLFYIHSPIPSLKELSKFHEFSQFHDLINQVLNEVEWLYEHDLLFDYDTIPREEKEVPISKKEHLVLFDELKFTLTAFNEYRKELRKKNFYKEKSYIKKILPLRILFESGYHAYNIRRIAYLLRLIYKWEIYPIVTTTDVPFEQKKANVLQLVLKSLPIPDELTPWEQILEFKSDIDSQEKFFALKIWINEIASQNLSINEIEEKLEWLLHSYKKHMELHKIRFKKGILEAFIITSAEVIEDTVNLRFSKLAKSLFSLRKKKIDLMETEMKAPGYEVSYIIKARERFTPKNSSY